MKQLSCAFISLALVFLGGCDQVSELISDNKNTATTANVAAQLERTYIFTAPPRESKEDGMKQYGVIAAYLSQVTGKKIEYVHQTNWISYLQGIKRGDYDIVFDGPHFNAWRNRYLNHEPVARIDFPCSDVERSSGSCKTFKPKWYLVYHKNTDTSRLGGRTFCLHAPPNFGTLSLMQTKFKDAAQQPYIKEMKGWVKMVRAVHDSSNSCEFTVSRMKHIKKVDPEGKVLAYEAFDAFVQQGFTVSRDLPEDMRQKIKSALLSPEGRNATEAFHKRFISAKHALQPYQDTADYDKAFDILAQQYLIPWALFEYPKKNKKVAMLMP